jgi:molecular chaperone DnaK
MSKNELAIGIDLGTSTSVVSLLRDGKPVSIPDPVEKTPIIPSVVGVNKRGELLTGQSALTNIVDPKSLVREAKRDMGTDALFHLGSHTLRAEEISSLVLKKMKEVAEGYCGESISKAVITVPAYFTDIERRATLNAAQLANIEVIRLINEPTAAAMAFGINNLDLEETILVFDMGGGTLDVSILEMISGVLDVKASDGDKHLGGKDIDSEIIKWATEEFSKKEGEVTITPEGAEGLKRKAEQAKKELSNGLSAEISVINAASKNGSPVDLELSLSQVQFNILISGIVARAIECIDRTLTKANMTAKEIGKVLLVGGSTYVPKVRQAVLEHLNKQEIRGVDPDLAVSQGAAISAALALGLIGDSESMVVQDSATHGFGILVVEEVGPQQMLVYSELMPPGTPVPYMCKSMYSLRRPDQNEMEIEVVHPIKTSAKLAQDTTPTGAQGVITEIPHALYGRPHDVEVLFSCDQNHVIQLTATILGTGKSCTFRLNGRPDLLGENEINQSLVKIEQLWSSSPLAQRHASLIRRAEAVLSNRPAKGELIEAALVDLKAQIAGNNAEAAQEARERLSELLAEV